MHKISAILIVFTLVFSGFTIATPAAEAACSYNGYWHSGGKCGKSFNKKQKKYSQSFSNDLIESYIRQLEELIRLLRSRQFDEDQDDDNSDVAVTTHSATNIDEDEATLRGKVDARGDEDVEVFFEYGRSRSNLNEDSTDENVEIDNGNAENFDIKINNLREDTLYYFRAVAEDEDGDRDYGSIFSFRTDSDQDTEPALNTRSATAITDNSADLRGTVDMEDFNNGKVFFVYGEDEDTIDDITDDYDKYSDINEDGEDLQKVLVDSDLDGSDNFTREIEGLDEDTRIYHAICVEYEDEDNDDTIDCGTTRSFETDN